MQIPKIKNRTKNMFSSLKMYFFIIAKDKKCSFHVFFLQKLAFPS